MRVTEAVKKQTENKILQAAEHLFSAVGYSETTTRQIASEAGIAAGTLFNYFPSKETLAMCLLAREFAAGRQDYLHKRNGDEDLAESLFLLVTSEIRRLRPYRIFVGPVLASTMSLFAKEHSCPSGADSRSAHLEIVRDIIHSHGFSRVPDYISTTLYWSLYLGILAFWSSDSSRNQEETLALIDYSIKVFSQTIANSTVPEVTS